MGHGPFAVCRRVHWVHTTCWWRKQSGVIKLFKRSCCFRSALTSAAACTESCHTVCISRYSMRRCMFSPGYGKVRCGERAISVGRSCEQSCRACAGTDMSFVHIDAKHRAEENAVLASCSLILKHVARMWLVSTAASWSCTLTAGKKRPTTRAELCA